MVTGHTHASSAAIRRRGLRVGFVVPWYGDEIGGGAEAECRGLIAGLRRLFPGVHVEVFTTALLEFSADWNSLHHQPGSYVESGVPVHRFPVEVRERRAFDQLNGARLMPSITADLYIGREGQLPRSPLTEAEEGFFLAHMVPSPQLCSELGRRFHDFDVFVVMPYLYTPAIGAVAAVQHKSALIPCLHDERYAYLEVVRTMMRSAGACLFHVHAEQALAERIYALPADRSFVIGEAIDTAPPPGDAARFRAKYELDGPFVLYAGRMIEGKGVPTLVDHFSWARQHHPAWADVSLVLIGKGDLHYDPDDYPGVRQLGFVAKQDKYDAFAAADIFCQPSLNESFSIVLMESWMQGRPALVADRCAVTKEHCELSGGGAPFHGAADFAEQGAQMLSDPQRATAMGAKGRAYVLRNFTEEVVLGRFVAALEAVRDRYLAEDLRREYVEKAVRH